MAEHSREAAWVHAYLHRVESDDGNAGYWYRQAQRKPATGPLEAEWEAMVAALPVPGRSARNPPSAGAQRGRKPPPLTKIRLNSGRKPLQTINNLQP